MKATTEKILEVCKVELNEEADQFFDAGLDMEAGEVHGYRIAEAKWMEAMREVVDHLDRMHKREVWADIPEANRPDEHYMENHRSEYPDCPTCALIAKYKGE